MRIAQLVSRDRREPVLCQPLRQCRLSRVSLVSPSLPPPPHKELCSLLVAASSWPAPCCPAGLRVINRASSTSPERGPGSPRVVPPKEGGREASLRPRIASPIATDATAVRTVRDALTE
ncbi:unnamed protein product [Lampetra planeri]